MIAMALLLWAAVLAAPPAGADMTYRVFTADNGLPQNSVYAIDQTPDGYLWIATHDGLVRFDGHRMTVFNHAEVPEILSNRVLALTVDREGSLWIGTEDGGVTRMKDGAFRTFGAADGLPEAAVGAIQEDGNGAIWVSTQRGLSRFDGTRWSTPDDGKSLAGEYQDLYSVGFWGPDGARLLDARGDWSRYELPPGLLPGRSHERHGPCWLRAAPDALLRLERGTVTKFDVPHGPGPPSERFALAGGRGDRIWLVLDERLSVFEGGAWRTFTTSLPEAARAPFTLFEDAEGSLWIGSEAGLVQAFTTPVRTIVPDAPPMEQRFYPIAEDVTGRVWGGTQSGSFRIAGERFERYGVGGASAILPEPDGAVLLGTYGGEVIRMRTDGRVERVHDDPGTIAALQRDRSGALWIGTSDGVIRLDASGAVKKLGPAEGLAAKRVIALLESAKGGMWVGCYGGLSRVDGEKVTTWKPADGLSSDKIRALHEDERGALWIGTYDGGLTRLLDGKLVKIRKHDGLFDDGAFSILDDGMGRLWMSCNRGIFAVPRAQLDDFAEGRAGYVTSRAFGRVDGMQSAECNGGYQPAGIRRGDGSLWFPTQRGIAIVDPSKVVANAVAPRVVIEAVASERRTHRIAPTVTLEPSENRLEVSFTATTFVRPEQARFRYRMEGLDDDWEEAGTARFARYSHVPPGRYVFRVVASNADGVWNREGASIGIRVLPAWWQTLWFRGGAILAGIGVAGLGVRSRFVRLKRRREEQDLFSRQLIASQEAERKRIAGELHDGIGQTLVVIRNRAQMGLRDEASVEARRQMEEIVEATGEGIEEVRKVAYHLRPYQLDRLGLTRAIEALVEQAAESSGLAIAKHLDPLDGVFGTDDAIGVYRIVQEALSNLLRHAHATRASVTVRASGGHVELVVEDDGRGFDAGALPADRPGMGLSGIAERARILGGRYTIQSSPGRGTRIVVVFPERGGSV